MKIMIAAVINLRSKFTSEIKNWLNKREQKQTALLQIKVIVRKYLNKLMPRASLVYEGRVESPAELPELVVGACAP